MAENPYMVSMLAAWQKHYEVWQRTIDLMEQYASSSDFNPQHWDCIVHSAECDAPVEFWR
mgnify:CR=1 FL=1